ncbi:hypothetical protein ACS8E3_03030 [Psychrobacter sp. 2Y5]|uniref:hypothetical protein n=1 Tax=unclassified Psychrobacter TaxID=196806 RepID=UPI003F48E368
MKSNTFNYSLLTVGVAAVMGLSTGANAAEATAVSAAAAPINNQATANYSVGTVPQPQVKSNTVTVNVSETSNFALVSTVADGTSNDDIAVNQKATPGGTTPFTHALTNTGNVNDTYTVRATDTDSSLVTAAPNYPLGVGTITYAIVKPDGTTPAVAADLATNQPVSGTLTNGGTIQLPPGFKAIITHAATTPTSAVGNNKGVGTLQATSNFNSQARTLINENQTIVKLPVFKIEKTATCGPSNTACTTLDLTAANPTIDYSIKVTNATTDYSDTATNFIVRDVLPLGITLNGNVTATGANVRAIGNEGGRQVIEVLVPSLAVGANQVISFKTNVNKDTFNTANSSVTNQATVYDKFNTDIPTSTDFDIVDSTDDSIPGNNVTKVPGEGAGTPGEDTTTKISFTNRNLTLASATIREIAPTTSTSTTNTDGQVTHVATITNLGQDVEGDANNPLTLTITDGTNAAVDPVLNQFFLVYTPPGGTAGQPIAVTPTRNDNVYTINSSQFPGGIPKGGKLEVRYNMSSTAAVIGSSENTVVKLTAGGTNAPTIPSFTDITNVKGLTLLKQVALQENCSGTISSYEGVLGANNTLSRTAKPGDCIYYKITANNTFTSTSGTAINNVVLSDLTSQWKPKSTYQPSTASSSNGGATTVTIANSGNATTEAVTTNLGSLAAGASGNMTFAIKVNP